MATRPSCVERLGVGVRLDGGCGGEHENFGLRVLRSVRDGPLWRSADTAAAWRRVDDADDGDGGDGGADILERKSGGGVAGDHEDVGALLEQEAGAGDGVAGDGLAGLRAVGEAGGVAEVEVAGVRDEGKEGAQDGQAAEAGVEDADGGQGLAGPVGRTAAVAVSICRVGAEEVGVAGEGLAGLAVDQEADLGEAGECGVEGADDRHQR